MAVVVVFVAAATVLFRQLTRLPSASRATGGSESAARISVEIAHVAEVFADDIMRTAAELDAPERVLESARAESRRTAREGERVADARGRNSVDLARLFLWMPEAVCVNWVLGNEDLNPSGVVVDDQAIRELQYVIDYYVTKAKPMMERWRNLRQDEMIGLVEAEAVAPSEPVYPSEDIAIRTVKTIMPSATRSEQEAMVKRLMAQPEGRGSFLSHKGHVYELASFESLPASDRVFEGLQFVNLEFLAAVITWLEARGITPAAVRARELARASKMTARSIRRS